MAVLEEFGDKLDAAVVISRKGEPQLDFHTGEYAAVAQTGTYDMAAAVALWRACMHRPLTSVSW